jgi:CheY-like chemotaxis protein
VLIAEDEVAIAMFIADTVERLGGTVVEIVSSAGRIADSAASHLPDIVLLDVNMRRSMTYEPAAELCRMGIPFIFVTGYSDLPDCPGDLADAPRLEKPFNAREIAQAIKETVGLPDTGRSAFRVSRNRRRDAMPSPSRRRH